MQYIGQTSRLPRERLREHLRVSSNCTKLRNELANNTVSSMETMLISGSHDIDDVERVAIALHDTCTHGLNTTVGGRGVRFPDEQYDAFRYAVQTADISSLSPREIDALRKLT